MAKKRIIPFIASILVASFTVQELAWAAPGAEVLARPVSASAATVASLDSVISDPSLLSVPFRFANAREVHAGTNGKLIIHIQDAHSNYGAQKNIAALLNGSIFN